MLDIFDVLNGFEESNYVKLLNDLGITPIWYSDHEEIADILKEVTA